MKIIRKIKSLLYKKNNKPSNIIDFPKVYDKEIVNVNDNSVKIHARKKSKQEIVKENQRKMIFVIIQVVFLFLTYLMLFVNVYVREYKYYKLNDEYERLNTEFSEVSQKYEALSKQLSD